MGESEADRIGLLHQLATLQPHPESVPINMLVRVAGTPLASMPALDPLRNGTRDSHRAHADARFARAPRGGTKTIVAGSGDAMFSCGRKFDFRRRKIADHSQPRRGRGRTAAADLGIEATRIACHLNLTNHCCGIASRAART